MCQYHESAGSRDSAEKQRLQPLHTPIGRGKREGRTILDEEKEGGVRLGEFR